MELQAWWAQSQGRMQPCPLCSYWSREPGEVFNTEAAASPKKMEIVSSLPGANGKIRQQRVWCLGALPDSP